MKQNTTLLKTNGLRSWSVVKSLLVFGMLLGSLFFSGNAFAQITQVGDDMSASTSGTTLTITKPVGLAVGDVMIVNIMQMDDDGANGGDLSAPTGSGWSLIDGRQLYASGSGGDEWYVALLYKVATSGDVSASNFAFTMDGDASGDSSNGALVAFRGANVTGGFNAAGAANSGPFDVDPGQITIMGTSNDDDVDAPSITTNTANSAVIMFAMIANDLGFTNGDWELATGPIAMTELYDEDNTSSLQAAIAAAWAVKPTAGSTGAGFADISGNLRYKAAMLLSLRPVTIATSATATSLCQGSNVSVPYTIAGAYASGNTFTAQLSDAAGSFASPTTIGSVASNAAGSISATIPSGQAAGTGYRIRVISSSPAAIGSNNGTNITVNASATANAGTVVSTCVNQSVNITAGSTASNNASVLWTSNGLGSISNSTSLTTATYNPALGESGTVTITLNAIGNGACTTATSNKTLTILAAPTASAGGSQTICQNGTATVSGASASGGTIAWTENGGGSLSNATTLTPTYTAVAGDGGNTVTLTMTVTNAGCAVTATYTVIVNRSATAVAGAAVSTCFNSGPVSITAGSSATNNSGIVWTHTGSGTIANANSMTLATYTPGLNEAGPVTLTLTSLGNAPCANATSNKTLTIVAQPTATAGGSTTICRNQTATVSGASSSNGTRLWTHNGGGSLSNTGTLTPTYTPGGADGGNTVTLTMTVTSAPCTAATATYSVAILAVPTSVAGTSVSTCSNQSVNITAGSSASNNTGVAWTHNGTGSIADANSLTLATYTPGPSESGSVTLTLTALGNAPCANVISAKTLTVNAIPVTTGVVICAGQSGSLQSSTVCPAGGAVLNLGPNGAGAGASVTGIGSVAWTSPGNVAAAGNATSNLGAGANTNYLRATGYGFSIPANATVTGVRVTINRFASQTAGVGCRDEAVHLVKANVIQTAIDKGTNTTWPTSLGTATYGSTSDMWGTTWTPSDINSASFGVAMSAHNNGSLTSRVATVDYIEVTVSYQLPGDINWYTAASGGTAIGTGASFNPVGVPGSSLANTNTPGTTTFYAECTAIAGCRTPTTFTINALPTVSFTGLDTAYCQLPDALPLTGNHAGGTFSGNGVTDNGNGTATFNPGLANVGVNAIVYTYTDGNTCVNSDSQNVTIVAPTTYYADADGDGFGDAAVTELSCNGPSEGFVANNTDCNDNQLQYLDADGDGFGSETQVACGVDNNTDCNDAELNYADLDNDGFGSTTFVNCGGVLNNTDCNDDELRYIDADGDGFGSTTFTDCDGVTNADDCDDNQLLYSDVDGDGFGAMPYVNCDGVLDNTDCDDNLLLYTDFDVDGFGALPYVNCGGVDNDQDCDDTQLQYLDNDGDGYGSNIHVGCGVSNSEDCDDSDEFKHTTYDFYVDADGDGYGTGELESVCATDAETAPAGYSLNNTDCNDGDENVFQTGTLYVDADNDGYTSGATQEVCYGVAVPSGYAATNIGIDCNDAIGAINPGASEILYNGIDDNCDTFLDEGHQITTKIKEEQCAQTLSSVNSAIVAYSKDHATRYRFEVTNTAEGGETQILERQQNYFIPTMLSPYNYATTYSIRVEIQRDGVWLGYYGEPCLVSTPAVLDPGGAATIQPSQCGGVLPSMTTIISTTSLPGVTGYRFRVTNITDTAAPYEVQTIDRGILHWFNLTMLQRYNYGTTYLIEVALKTNGTYSEFGSPCAITTPAVPRLINCENSYVVPTKHTMVAAAARDRITSYRFEITNMTTEQVVTVDRTINWFNFNSVPGFTAGGAYGVRIQVMTTGVYSPWSDACEITAPASARADQSKENFFEAVAYPNPFAENFMIDVSTSSEANLNVKVYDMTGRLLESKNIGLYEMKTLQVGDRYPAGVYNVIVGQGENLKTLRVVKR